jgi:hypothetical protein
VKKDWDINDPDDRAAGIATSTGFYHNQFPGLTWDDRVRLGRAIEKIFYGDQPTGPEEHLYLIKTYFWQALPYGPNALTAPQLEALRERAIKMCGLKIEAVTRR